MGYSGLSLLGRAISGRKWPEIIPHSQLRSNYDIVIIGGGGHGLATAHYLASQHGITDVAVLEAGWIGGGNTARNTTIVRSDYFLEASFRLKNFALELWDSLSRDLNFNIMYSPRGYVDLAHSDGELEHFTQRANAMCLGGAQADILSLEKLKKRVPQIELNNNARFPIVGALIQDKGGVVRHDAVAWGFAKTCSQAGIDVAQHCPVSGFETANGAVTAVETPLGKIGCDKVLISVAGATSQVAQMAGIALPIQSINVQAFVSEPVKPALDSVVNYNAGLSYVSQTDKGEFVFGGATDGYPSFARRGSFSAIEDTLVRVCQMFPMVSRLRLMRHWSGTADISMDGNAIMGETPLKNFYINGAWGYSGFKATPAVGWCLADMLANKLTPDLIAPFSLQRFEDGKLIDDSGVGPYPWLH